MDANKIEHKQLEEYNVFLDKGKFTGCGIPCGYQLIRVYIIFDIKVDVRHKAQIVADGHLTATFTESVYSGVITLRGLQMCLFIGVLDIIEPWVTKIGNAYLEALSSKNVCIGNGPEFEPDLEGYLFIIYKALYGLKLSRKKAIGQML